MTKRLILYGVILAILAIALELMQYKLVVRNHAIELYGGIIALLFTILGVVAGKKLTQPKEVIIEHPVLIPAPIPEFVAPETQIEKLNISKREYEVLCLMAEGLSNQEIADKTFVSINTVKTHVSSLLLKLDAKRRTQAVIKAREMCLIP